MEEAGLFFLPTMQSSYLKAIYHCLHLGYNNIGMQHQNVKGM